MAGERRRREQLLLRTGFDLAADVTPAVVVQRIVDLAAEMAGAARACLIVLATDGQVGRFVTSGVARERRKVDRAAAEEGLLGPVLRDGKAVRVTGVEDDPSLIGLPRDHGPISVLGVPVYAGRRMLGALWLADSEAGEEFTEDDERALGFFAAQAGVALENARLLEEARVRQRALEGVKAVSQALLEGQSTDDVLQLVARWARELVRSAFAGVVTPIVGSDTLVVRVVEGEHTEGMVGTTFRGASSISGDVIGTLEPVVVADASRDHRRSQPIVHAGACQRMEHGRWSRAPSAFGPQLAPDATEAHPGRASVMRRRRASSSTSSCPFSLSAVRTHPAPPLVRGPCCVFGYGTRRPCGRSSWWCGRRRCRAGCGRPGSVRRAPRRTRGSTGGHAPLWLGGWRR
ncbi:MAG TPA: GAF domain-containing protein [Acidimicrobiales bacterium]|nr:GAF domain-containing protein [Acidimicrobiales bacterium]